MIRRKTGRLAVTILLGLSAAAGSASSPVGAQSTSAVAATPPQVVLQAGAVDSGTFVGPAVLPGKVPTSTFQITYTGVPTAAQTAFQKAADLWANLVTSSVPIQVAVKFESMAAGSLGSGGPLLFRDFAGAPRASTYYPSALAEALTGTGISGADPDINVSFNSNRTDFYFGTDGHPPSGRFDFVTIAFHELGHGLGFLGGMDGSASQGKWLLDAPTIYDRFTQTSTGQLLATIPQPSTTLGNALRSNQLYWSSSFTNRGTADRPRLYAPNPWQPVSSYNHLDESTYLPGTANALMTPTLDPSEATHTPGPLALCMYEAMGWSTSQACTPPAMTLVNGFTWFSGGVSGGPSGSTLGAFATDAATGRSYKLVTGLDGGPDFPCMWDTVPLNTANRLPSSSGFIGGTSGVVTRPSGPWQVCFREESATANPLRVTLPRTYTVS